MARTGVCQRRPRGDVWWHQRREMKLMGQDMKDSLSSSTGSQFFQKLVYRYEQERARRTQPKNKWAENDGLKLYPTFEGTSQGNLLLNTVNVDSQRQVARVLCGKTLALKMGWIEKSPSGHFDWDLICRKNFIRTRFPHRTMSRMRPTSPPFGKWMGLIWC